MDDCIGGYVDDCGLEKYEDERAGIMDSSVGSRSSRSYG